MHLRLTTRNFAPPAMFATPSKSFKFAIILALLISCCHGNVVKRGACRQPSQSELVARLRQHTWNALSFATATVGVYNKPASTACPLTYGYGAPLERRSTCPFYHVENTDVDRFPSTLLEARCFRCHTCITNLRNRRHHHPNWRCEKVVTPKLWVLRNTYECNNDGEYIYAFERISLQVGCTCGRSRY
ncbi:uncharacterized protein [Ptychodera flava]|uniref:uncharacterized protein n=1 Tax=Ptychodera flava TaxID=63121 RepID=UPI00396A5BD9